MGDEELSAMQLVLDTLEGLDGEARLRVLSWVTNKLGLKRSLPAHAEPGAEPKNGGGLANFLSFADLFTATSPSNNAEKALVAGYWLQICQGQEQFTSQAANKELQNLGHVVSNITDAFGQLQAKKPALAIQVKKSGKSQQARKQYKLTQAGVDAVKNMQGNVSE
jgi:hypothetical protein